MQLLKKIALTLSSLLLVVLIALMISPELQARAEAYWATTLTIVNNLRTSAVVAGENAFTTTAFRDTVVITGAASTDFYLLSAENDSSGASLGYIAKADTLIVLRKTGGTSALGYAYLRVRPR